MTNRYVCDDYYNNKDNNDQQSVTASAGISLKTATMKSRKVCITVTVVIMMTGMVGFEIWLSNSYLHLSSLYDDIIATSVNLLGSSVFYFENDNYTTDVVIGIDPAYVQIKESDKPDDIVSERAHSSIITNGIVSVTFVSLSNDNSSVDHDETFFTNARSPRNTVRWWIHTRAYPFWKVQYNQSVLPCYRPTLSNSIDPILWADKKMNRVRKQSTSIGLFFVKLCKTASTTAASIHLRIARNEANRQHNNNLLILNKTIPTMLNRRMIDGFTVSPTEIFDESDGTILKNNLSSSYEETKEDDNNDDEDADNVEVNEDHDDDQNNDDNDHDHEYWPVCRTRHLHGTAFRMYKFHLRNLVGKSFLWTMVREPTERYVSEFFHFVVSRKYNGTYPSDFTFIDYLKNGKHANQHYLAWLSLKHFHYRPTLFPNVVPQSPSSSSNYQETNSNSSSSSSSAYYKLNKPQKHFLQRTGAIINNIIQMYDFIGITERFDESIVALMILLDIPMADILYIKSKTSWDYYNGLASTCLPIHKPIITPRVQQFLSSNEWKMYIFNEQVLYEAAIRNLNETIYKTIGYTLFTKQLQKFRNAQKRVAEKCTSILTTTPCHPQTGDKVINHDCLQLDMGCGYTCLDEVSDEMNLW